MAYKTELITDINALKFIELNYYCLDIGNCLHMLQEID